MAFAIYSVEVKMTKLRVGVIGCGAMGTHLANQCASLPNAEVIAMCDIVRERADKLAEAFKAKSFTKYKSLLKKGDVDAVIVATPNNSHAKITIDSARAGKHIFCEKPMALTLKECDAMIAAAKKAGVMLMVGQVLRLFPVFWRTKQIIASGELGKPFGMFVQRTGQADAFRHKTWRGYRKSCGGLLLEINAHELDFMRFILGEATEVYAQMGNFCSPESEIEDLAFVTIKFASRAIAILHSSTAVSIGEYRNTIQCAEGTLTNGGFGGPIQYQRNGGEVVTIEASEIEKPEPYQDELASFVNTITTGSPMVFDARDGRAAVELALAAYRSAKTGKAVKLPL